MSSQRVLRSNSANDKYNSHQRHCQYFLPPIRRFWSQHHANVHHRGLPQQFFVAKTCCVDVADSRRCGGQSLQVLEHPLAVGGLARVEDEGAGAG